MDKANQCDNYYSWLDGWYNDVEEDAGWSCTKGTGTIDQPRVNPLRNANQQEGIERGKTNGLHEDNSLWSVGVKR